MSDTDEKRAEDEEVVEAAPKEDEGAEVEGHKWAHEASKVSEPGKVSKAY
jgi:hypothetical protein